MASLDDFSDITLRDEPLAPHTYLTIGGPAEFLVTPRTRDELKAVIACCRENEIPIRILGAGSNLLVSDEGVKGVVIRLGGEEFSRVTIEETRVTAGAAVTLTHLIGETIRAGLIGLEALVGIPGTVGGALHGNAGGRSGDIGQFVKSVQVMTATGDVFTRGEDELLFAYRSSNLDELTILDATFELQQGDLDETTRRVRKLWIMKKATQPLTVQSAGCIFKNPRGMSAGTLIDQAGLKGSQVGKAEISDRHANFIVTNEGATAQDVLGLIESARTKVAERFGVDLELEIEIW